MDALEMSFQKALEQASTAKQTGEAIAEYAWQRGYDHAIHTICHSVPDVVFRLGYFLGVVSAFVSYVIARLVFG